MDRYRVTLERLSAGVVIDGMTRSGEIGSSIVSSDVVGRLLCAAMEWASRDSGEVIEGIVVSLIPYLPDEGFCGVLIPMADAVERRWSGINDLAECFSVTINEAKLIEEV